MRLTELQQIRIKQHLELASDLAGVMSIIRDQRLLTLTDTQIRVVVGSNLDALEESLVIRYDGEVICTAESLLGQCELAHARISPTVIEESLYVAKVGDISLRGSELQNRKNLYNTLVQRLASVVGVEPHSQGRAEFN